MGRPPGQSTIREPARPDNATPSTPPRDGREDLDAQYVESFVDRWDDLIDWDRRQEAESGFFVEQLRRRGVRRVLDAATGTGYHSVTLIEAGFEVTSIDASPEMLRRAAVNGSRRGHELRLVQADWRELDQVLDERFDAIVCLGSSFPHVFSAEGRARALAQFHAALAPGGVLIVDQRNFDAILRGRYRPAASVYYCGEGVSVSVDHASEDLVRFRYDFTDGASYTLQVFPLRSEDTRTLLFQAGFGKVVTYGDFATDFDPDAAGFIIHVAEKG